MLSESNASLNKNSVLNTGDLITWVSKENTIDLQDDGTYDKHTLTPLIIDLNLHIKSLFFNSIG